MTSTEAHDNILAALRALAAACDGAVTQDKKGFNGLESDYGKELASKQRLSRKQLESAFELLGKYRKQLSEKHGIELVPELPPRKTIATPDRSNPLKTAMDALWDDAERVVGMHPAETLIADFVGSHPAEDFIADPVGKTQPFWTEGDEILDGIFATASQAKALNALWAWYHGTDEEFLLMGFAGTGKTVLYQAFLTALIKHNVRPTTVGSAPTNKATNVLAAMVEQWKLGITCKTVASLLGLRPKRDYRTGLEYFVPDPKSRRPAEFFQLLEVDEASMIGDDVTIEDSRHGRQVIPGLFKLIRSGIISGPMANMTTYSKVLWMGDPAQVPPVGQECSPVFAGVKNRAILTDVCRYGGAILELANQIRDNLNDPNPPQMVSNPDEGLWVLGKEKFDRWLVTAADRGAFEDGSSRAIAWRNDRVDEMGRLIRSQVYGPDSPAFMPGELIVVGSAYAHTYTDCDGRDTSDVVLKTSEEFYIDDAYEGTKTINGIEEPALGIGPNDATWKVWWVTFKGDPFFIETRNSFGEADMIQVDRFAVLHHGEKRRYEAAVKRFAKERQWAQYFRLKDAFADIRAASSITTHKSQGSTFDAVFVDYSDIKRCKAKGKYYDYETDSLKPCHEWRRLFYTAITRPQSKLIIRV